MTNTFVILAAGRGSRLGRVGDELHKCLIPLDSRAIITRQLELAPPKSKIVVVTGYRADQVETYVRLAHPNLDVTFVREIDWGHGPGRSLLMAEHEIEGDLIFTACDTLWEHEPKLWELDQTWLAVAPIPAGTPAARWCRLVDNDGFVSSIIDKTPEIVPNALAWTALGRISADDLETFWAGLHDAEVHSGELQLSSGFKALHHAGTPIITQHIRWLDVGDEEAYRVAQAQFGVYDTVKPGQATYVMPREDRVVKFCADHIRIENRIQRGSQLKHVTPPLRGTRSVDMVGYQYVPGMTVYEEFKVNRVGGTDDILTWWHVNFWSRRLKEMPHNWVEAASSFYHGRVYERVNQLNPMLRARALDVVTRINWDELIDETTPGPFHGDLTYANVIRTFAGHLVAIDWRDEFSGQTAWGDLRYDLAKLLGATQFHWGNAVQGDFRFWPQGDDEAAKIIKFASETCELDVLQLNIMAALTLIASAPLHASPMDEILVARGTHWLERYL